MWTPTKCDGGECQMHTNETKGGKKTAIFNPYQNPHEEFQTEEQFNSTTLDNWS